MDKLQPILAHRFWIVLGVAILLALGAWYTGTGALAEQIAADEAVVTSLAVTPGAGAPNPSFVEGAENEAAKRATELKMHARDLATTQEDMRIWPARYQRYVEDLEYFEPFEDVLGPREQRQAREAYRDVYQPQIDALRESLNIYDFETETGAVNVPEGVLPTFDYSDWQSDPPHSMTVWSAQEDIWLMKELLGQLTLVNEGKDSILKAPLKELQSFTLRGGSSGEEDLVEGDPSAVGPEGPPTGRFDAEYERRMAMEAQRGAGGSLQSEIQFPLEDEVGSAEGVDEDPSLTPPGMEEEGAEAAAEGPPTEPMSEFSDGFDMMDEQQRIDFVTPGGGRRYVASAEELPYRTRAFRMQFAVDHRELTNVLVDLSNSRWPVEIKRVHFAEGTSPVGESVSGTRRRGGLRPGMPAGLRPGMRPGLRPGRRPGQGTGMSSRIGPDGPPGMPRSIGPRMNGGTNREMPDAANTYEAAMADPYLVTVVVGGVMTIYKPRPEDEVLPETADPTATVGADGDDPASVDNLPVGVQTDPAATDDPAAVDPGAADAVPEAAAEEVDFDLNTDAAADPGAGEFELNADPPTSSPASSADPTAADPTAADPAAADPTAAEPVATGAG